MSSLGDVLELIFSRPGLAVSVKATIRERSDQAQVERLGHVAGRQVRVSMPLGARLLLVPLTAVGMAASIARGRRRSRLPGPDGESELTIWLDSRSRCRLERAWLTPAGQERLATVTAAGGHFGWSALESRDLTRGRVIGPGIWPAPGAIDAERLFLHSQLREMLNCLILDPVGEGEIAGRQVVVVRAVRSEAFGLWPHWLPFGADDYELAFDLEFGSVLSIKGRSGGEVFEEVEVREITYGGPIDDALFELS